MTEKNRAPTGQFVHDIAEIDPKDTRRFGGKATGLAKMTGAGLAVPPAFVISTAGFHAFRDNGGQLPALLLNEVHAAVRRLETASGKSFGGGGRPLLLSVRSGAAISMPGMMDTVLNLGLDAQRTANLADLAGDRAFAVDTWLRFWRMYADTVLAIDPLELAAAIEPAAQTARLGGGPAAFAELENVILAAVRAAGEEPEAAPARHLERTIGAVFESWDSARAKAYRKHHNIADDLGTAVTIQAMVFGNLDENSGSGVAFTRNPNTGESTLYGEYLTGRQGEDLVSGTHTPVDLADQRGLPAGLRESLLACGRQLEALYHDAVDIEFTVEASRLYLLQVRPAKRTADAAVRIAVESVLEGLMTRADALTRVSTEQLRKLLRPAFDEAGLRRARVLAQGLGSSPGHAHGSAVLDADSAAARAAQGEQVILIRPTTSPQDIRGMLTAAGIVTAKGGALSHAAVVSRALDKPCVVGCGDIVIDEQGRRFSVGGMAFDEGDPVSIDGTSGRLYAGIIELQHSASHNSAVKQLLAWADARSQTEIWPATRGAVEIKDAAQAEPRGLGIIGLTDLLISSGNIDSFVALLSGLGDAGREDARSAEMSALVQQSCVPAMADSRGLPLHIRLPRVSSDRARRLVANWVELPAQLFLPLGMPAYHAAILQGLAAAARETGHAKVTALIAGITDVRELQRFCEAAARTGMLAAGAMIQNIAALGACAEMAKLGVPLWIETSEIIRTMYGFPTEVLDVQSAMRDYTAAGFVAANPLTGLGSFLAGIVLPLSSGENGVRSIGIDGAGCSSELIVELFRKGFRTFSVPLSQRDEFRLLLGQKALEVGDGG